MRVAALVAGLAGAVLLPGGPPGIGVAIVAVLAAVAVALVARPCLDTLLFGALALALASVAALRDSGWVAGGPTSRSAAMAWSRPDSAGRPMHVVLSVVTASQDTTCKVVNMEIQRARP